jgi:hypothetical protein
LYYHEVYGSNTEWVLYRVISAEITGPLPAVTSMYSVKEFFFFSLMWVYGQLARTSTNSTGPEVNDYVSLQWPSYEQPQDLNLRPQGEQTSWSQTLTTGPPPR